MLIATIQWYVAANERRTHLSFNRLIGSEDVRKQYHLNGGLLNPHDEVARLEINTETLKEIGATENEIALFSDFLRSYADYGFNNEFREYFQFRADEELPLRLYHPDKKKGLVVRCRDSGVLQATHHISTPNEARLIIDLEGTVAGKNLILQVLRACPSPNSLLVRNRLHDR